jgi:hypothetical protein
MYEHALCKTFEVFSALMLHTAVFSVVRQCHAVRGYQRSGGTNYLHIQAENKLHRQDSRRPKSDSLCMHGHKHIHTYINNLTVIACMISSAMHYILVCRHVEKVNKVRCRNRMQGRNGGLQTCKADRLTVTEDSPSETCINRLLYEELFSIYRASPLVDSVAFPFMHRLSLFFGGTKTLYSDCSWTLCPCIVWPGLFSGEDFVWNECRLSACALDRFL